MRRRLRVEQFPGLSRESQMDKHIWQGKWKRVVGKAQQQWSRLTRNNRAWIRGKRTELAGLLQEKYGHARRGVRRFLREVNVR